MKAKRVCHMTSVHPPKDVRIFYKMCTSLAREGYETYLVAPGESFAENGVRVIGAGDKPASRLKRMTGMSRRVYELAREVDADLYHFHDPELLPYGLKLKKQGKAVIFDSHEDTVDQIMAKRWIPFPLRRIIASSFAVYQRYVCNRLNALIYVSPHIAFRFEAFSIIKYMITNFPMVAERDFIPPTFERRSIGFAGGITEQWSHDTIVKALNEASVTYELAGPVSEAYLKDLQALPNWDRVRFHARIPFAEVANLLQRQMAGACLLRRLQNDDKEVGTLGNTKIFEYMQAGLPLICTNTTLWREIIEKWDCGILVNDPDDPSEVARAIRKLVDNPGEARRMGENGRRAVLGQYNWEAEEQKLFALYRELFAQEMKCP